MKDNSSSWCLLSMFLVFYHKYIMIRLNISASGQTQAPNTSSSTNLTTIMKQCKLNPKSSSNVLQQCWLQPHADKMFQAPFWSLKVNLNRNMEQGAHSLKHFTCGCPASTLLLPTIKSNFLFYFINGHDRELVCNYMVVTRMWGKF
jgi:hypothetical protein